MISPSQTAQTPPKALFLIPNLRLGGAERVFAHFVNSLSAVDVSVLLHEGDISQLNPLRPDLPCDALRPAGEGAPSSLTARAQDALAVRGLLAGGRVDLVSSFLHKSNRVASVAKLLSRRRIPLVLNVHEMMSQHIRFVHSAPLERAFHRWSTRWLFKLANRVVAPAEGVVRDLEEHWGVPKKKLRIVRNPIDLATIRTRAEESLPVGPYPEHRRHWIVAVGRLHEHKGFDLLIQAVEGLPSELDAGLVIVGGGDEEPTLKALIESRGLGDRVLLVGTQDNPWKYMAKAEVFALPSLIEAFPNVLGEAMALGLAIVAADCSPGIREYLENGECGLLVPPGDVTTLTKGLERVLRDNELRSGLGERAYERVQEVDRPKVVREYGEFLLQVVEDSRR